MTARSTKQLTISKFFAPVNAGSRSSLRTDDDVNISKRLKEDRQAEVSVGPALKRSKSSTAKVTPKRAKHDDREKKPETQKIFRRNSSEILDNSYTSDNGSPEILCNRSPSTSPVKSPNSLSQSPSKNNSAFKNKLNAFRSNSDKLKCTTDGSDQENSVEESQAILTKTSSCRFKVPPGAKLTPLEQQVVALKNNYPDVILFIECGYKYRFFGEDAETAAKELNIIAHQDHNFQTASIPTHRLHVHVRRLVAKGYKVGVVKQTETAALKAISNKKSAPFTRELTSVYTKATLIGEDVTPVGGEDTADVTEATSTSLMVLMEAKPSSSRDKQIGIAFVSVQPSTGEILFDYFDDSVTRTALWGRLEHIHPVEVILEENVSSVTRKAITSVTTRHGDCIRLEHLPEEVFSYSSCLKSLCELYEGREDRLRHISDLPHPVISCLGATLHYLKEFKLERVIKAASTISKYSSDKQFMNLPGATLRNLEVLLNSDDGQEKGSLFWVLNQTCTKFGARILREWLVNPLLDVERIVERQSAIEELTSSDANPITFLATVLQKLPDFQKSITTIFHKKCSPYEFWVTTSGLARIHQQLSSVCRSNLQDIIESALLVQLFTTVIERLSDIHQFSELFDQQSAKDNNKTTLLKDWSEFKDVISRQQEISQIEGQLNEQRSKISRTLGVPSFSYTTVSGLEYLVEVKNVNLRSVPSNWSKINSTKTCCRFRSPEVEKLFTKLQQLREQLQADCHSAWLEILDRFSEHYQEYREAVKCLGTLDALLSLAKVASANGYCRPEVIESDEGLLQIEGGKHPIVSHFGGGAEQFVANDTDMKADGKRVMIVTGPNMGGKSCYMRQVALIAMMAQIGSSVPADSVKLSIIDGIYTRMGATDEIFSGKSTFMVEVGETADIMCSATKRSLVIVDELGRGTSTYDGVAIAMATLDYFIKVKCLTIFVTHYLPLTEFEVLYPETVGNYHMAFIVNEEDEAGIDVVTFLYQLTEGSAGQSYGLNVARLANVPTTIITRAAEKSRMLEDICTRKRRSKEDLQNLISGSKEDLRNILKNL